ncbi:MAG: DUF3857 and transglutaminase domain-containing protein [Acidobacteriota bacterium]|nr:DUF3857 and transglutaminase domain-containing protein [Acidobacteriota bacterium]
MFPFSGKRFISLCFVCLLFVSSQSVFAGGNDEWRAVSPEELAMKTPKVDPDADAEAIFWEVRIDDSSSDDLALKHYVRVKIFTERGREKYSKIDIPFYKGMKIKDVAARVIKTDGTIIEINKADVFEREIAKADGIKIKAKSFAVPNIEPGIILEYRYREVINDSSAGNMDLRFQRDIPIQESSYYVKPYAYNSAMKVIPFNMGDTKFVEDKKGFYVARMTNVPALKEEPRMPPEDEVRSWMLIYYNGAQNNWAFLSNAFGKGFKDASKPNGEVKSKAQEIAGNAATDDEKLSKLFQFAKTQIKNVSYDTALAAEERAEIIKKNKNAGDVLKNKQGGTADIDLLFGSMAIALGYDARMVLSGDRSELFFKPQNQSIRFVHPCCVAVKVNNNWKFYNPGAYFVSEGMLAWNEEQTNAMVAGDKDFYWVETPISDVEKTIAKRTGKFVLAEDGTLEGTVRIEYTGHLAYSYKMQNYAESANTREENLKNEIKKRISTAEISNIVVENTNDPEKPFVYQYKLRVPNYAQRTGKRLFLQPGFFEYGAEPMFSSGTRKYDVYFHYPWSEQDRITIELPKGFALDSPDMPAPISDPKKIGLLEIKIGVDKDQTFMKYERNFHFGGGGLTLFPVVAYPQLKNMFDAFHKSDTHTITLKQSTVISQQKTGN